MVGQKQFLDNVYDLEGGQTTQALYDAWSESYDAEVGDNGYATPGRAAEALAQFTDDRALPILDLGCGTGLSGAAFKAAGFMTIDGSDFSTKMLEQARSKGIYRRLTVANLVEPMPFEPGTYAAIAAIGVLNPGHGPAQVMNDILEKLTPGGLFVFSLNDHALKDSTYNGQLNNIIDSGWARLLFREYGSHLPARDIQSYVYVLQKP